MAEKGIRGGICHAIHRYAKAGNKYMKNYAKNEESSFFVMAGQTIYMAGQEFNNYQLMVLIC